MKSHRGEISILAADYSQIELRIMAHLSADTQDVHAATAAEVFDVPLESVSAGQRRKAKALNFGLIYGRSSNDAKGEDS